MRNTIRRWSLGLASGLLLLGFATPGRAATSAWLGVVTQEVTDDLRDALDLQGDGVLVNSVYPGSPAERGGIRKGDVITSFNDHSVDSPGALSDAVGDEPVGSNATVKLLRRGTTQTVTVKLGTRPDSSDLKDETPTPGARREVRAWKNGKEVDPDNLDFDLPNLKHLDGLGAMPRMVFMNRGRLGVRIQELNPDLAGYFGGSNGKGALILEVIEGTPADKAGLKAGDVIVRMGTQDIASPEDLVRALRDEEGKVTLSVVRKGVKRSVDAELGDAMRDRRVTRFENRTPRPESSGPENEELRQQLDDLRQQLREMKKQLDDRNR